MGALLFLLWGFFPGHWRMAHEFAIAGRPGCCTLGCYQGPPGNPEVFGRRVSREQQGGPRIDRQGQLDTTDVGGLHGGDGWKGWVMLLALD